MHTEAPFSDPAVLGVALAGLCAPGLGTRAALEQAATLGARWIALDAAAPDSRGRDLDRSARRDLAAQLRRTGLDLAGLDLWIPPRHFIDAARCDRAIAAALDAIDLAADLAALQHHHAGAPLTRTPVVSVIFPTDLSPSTRGVIASRAHDRRVRLADHAWPPAPAATDPPIDIGVDPATVIIARADPAAAVLMLGQRLAIARLSDASPSGRAEPGSAHSGGTLDEPAYLIALAASSYSGPLMIDARGLADPLHSARAAITRLSRAPA